MTTRAKFDTLPELVKPKLTDIAVELIPQTELKPASTAGRGSMLVADAQSSSVSDVKKSSSGYEWKSWTLSFSLSNVRTLVKRVNDFLEVYAKVMAAVVQILKIIRLFSGLTKSIAMFIQFMIKMIAESLKELVDSLASTGIYLCVIMDKKGPNQFALGGSDTHGGFQELISRINFVCSSSDDPDAPRFNDPKDRVGGVIIASVAGMNNPRLIKDLQDNVKKILDLFGLGSPYPDPAVNFKAKAGLYKDFSDRSTKDKKIGVVLTWEDPERHVDGFAVYRATSPRGSPRSIMKYGVPLPYRIPGEQITYVNTVRGNPFYRYTDFDVKEDVQYYYKVYSTYDEDWLGKTPDMQDVGSPAATPFRMAKCKRCIPISELKGHTVQKLNGEFLDAILDWRSDWQSLTVRSVMSKQLDVLFAKIDLVTDKLLGAVNSSSAAMSKYIGIYEKKLGKIIDVMEAIQEIIELLMSFTLRGTFLVLTLPVEEGGMAGFVDRLNSASRLDNVEKENKQPDNPFAVSQGGIAQFTERGVYFGLIMLFGYPFVDKERLDEMFLPEETGGVEVKIKATQKAVETLLKLLGLGG